jgi:hypothetical protein
MDANPESEQFIFNNFWQGFKRIRFLDTQTLQKISCIAGSDAYDGSCLRQTFLMIHRNAQFLDTWRLWAGNGMRSRGQIEAETGCLSFPHRKGLSLDAANVRRQAFTLTSDV